MKRKIKIRKALVVIGCGLTVAVFIGVICYIFVMGFPNLNFGLFSLQYNSNNVSLVPALINTLSLTVVSLLIAFPLGLFSSIFLVEYSKKNSRLVKIIRLTAETLSGIPSIVYGLFGFLMFVSSFKLGYSLLSGAFTLSIMILPTILRSCEEALIAVSDTYREGSLALGAGKLYTVFKVVLPSAMPGILSGIVLSIGRIVGETAALIYTAGTVAQIPTTLFGSGRTLAVHMYALWNEGFNTKESYATALVLVVFVVILNSLSSYFAKQITKGKR